MFSNVESPLSLLPIYPLRRSLVRERDFAIDGHADVGTEVFARAAVEKVTEENEAGKSEQK